MTGKELKTKMLCVEHIVGILPPLPALEDRLSTVVRHRLDGLWDDVSRVVQRVAHALDPL